jgi:hypothetical protein
MSELSPGAKFILSQAYGDLVRALRAVGPRHAALACYAAFSDDEWVRGLSALPDNVRPPRPSLRVVGNSGD